MPITAVRALAVLGDAQAVIDRGVAAGGVQARGRTNIGGVDPHRSGARASGEFSGTADELAPVGEIVAFAAGVDEAAG